MRWPSLRPLVGRLSRSVVDRLPVDATVPIFRALAPLASVPEEARRFGLGLGLRGVDLERWERRVWWGSAASYSVKERLARGHDRGLERLLLPVDWTPLEAALDGGRGAVLAGARIGPGGVVAWAASRRFPDVLCLLGHGLGPTPALRVHDVTQPASRATALAAARVVLRRGGVVFLLADGYRPPDAAIGEAAPLLARLCGAPTVPACALWHGGRIRVALAPPIAPGGDDPDAWTRAWRETFARWLEGHLRGPAENLQLDGGGVWFPLFPRPTSP